MIKKCIVGLLFTFGFALIAYPMVSNYMFENQQNSIIKTYEMTAEIIPDQNKEEILTVAQEYNASLLTDNLQLYDSLTGNVTMAENKDYNGLLSIDDSEMIGSLSVPCIDVNLPIYYGSDEEFLKKGVICMDNTSLPIGGENTHAVLVGHTGLSNAKLLTDLIKVEIGDIFNINVLGDTITYEVDQIKTVYPDDVLYVVNDIFRTVLGVFA